MLNLSGDSYEFLIRVAGGGWCNSTICYQTCVFYISEWYVGQRRRRTEDITNIAVLGLKSLAGFMSSIEDL